MSHSRHLSRLFNLPVQLILTLILLGGIWGFWNSINMEDALIAQGDAFREVGQLDFAQRSYQQVLDYDANNPQAQYQAAILTAQQGNSTGALVIFDTLLTQDFPQPARIHIQRGWIFYNLGNVAQADAAFRQALALIEQDVSRYNTNDIGEVYAGLGWTSFLSGRGCDEALSYFAVALDATPQLAIAQRGQATCGE